MSYRPEGWFNPHPDINKGLPLHDFWDPEYDLFGEFEAGADAMLKGLVEQPANRGGNVLYVDTEADGSTILHNPHRKGWLVFIPEEEEK